MLSDVNLQLHLNLFLLNTSHYDGVTQLLSQVFVTVKISG